MKKHLLTLALALTGLAGITGSRGQTTNVGIGTITPNAGAQLDVTSPQTAPGSSRGLIGPRVPLSGGSVWTLAGSPTDGMIVFNTATVTGGDPITPGYYYWYNNRWIAFFESTAPQITGTATINCANVAANITPTTTTFTNGQAYSGTVTIPYTSGNGGNYAADAISQNGLTFSHPSGTLSNGSGNIIYSVSGTYIGSTGSTETVIFNLPGNTCAVTLPQVATFTAGSLTCNSGTAATGTYQVGVAMNSANTKTINITPSAAGAYSFSTNAQNGVSFSAAGAFNAGQAGTSQAVSLKGSGTPLASGTFTYTVTAGGQTCTFTVTFTSAATFNCAGATQTQTPVGALVTGTSYTGSYTIPYTAGNGGAYGATSQTINGLTLTRTAGTYLAGGGNVVYNLSGTYTGTNNGTVAFPIAECSNAVFGDAIRGALSAGGCASCYAYDNAAVNDWVPITAAEYAALANTANIAGAAKGGMPDANMSSVGAAFQGAYTVGLGSGYATIPASSYIVGFMIANGGGGSGARTGAKVKVGTAPTAGYVQINNALPTYTPAYPSFTYYVAKRPTGQTPASVGYLGAYGGTNSAAYFGTNGSGGYYNYGDVSNPTATGYTHQIQSVNTTTRQW